MVELSSGRQVQELAYHSTSTVVGKLLSFYFEKSLYSYGPQGGHGAMYTLDLDSLQRVIEVLHPTGRLAAGVMTPAIWKSPFRRACSAVSYPKVRVISKWIVPSGKQAVFSVRFVLSERGMTS